jgi:DNA polymerase III subunit epsilon
MIKIMFFDTETTGVNKQVDRIIQFGAIYWSYDPEKGVFYEERVINQYISPWETKISPEAHNAHGLNSDFVAQFDTMDKYIKEILAYMLKCNIIVWHNLDFDRGMIHSELDRYWLEHWVFAKRHCTMKNSTDYCKLPWKYGHKRPSLQELHQKLFSTDFDWAHDALSDIRATSKCYREMVKLWLFTI